MTNGIGFTSSTGYIAQKIDKKMVDAVTEAIFQRAASKSSSQAAVEASTSNNIYNQASMKASLQNEVMMEARNSLAKAANPFSEGLLAQQVQQAQPKQQTSAAASTNATEAQAGSKAFVNNASVKQNNKVRVSGSTTLQNGLLSSAMRESMLIQAKEELVKNNDLMSRLQFLNTKTAVSSYPAKQFD